MAQHRDACPERSRRAAIVHADGAAINNPGPAGAGAVVRSASGEVLAELAVPLGRTTNNVAEYQAVIRGLQEALALGFREVEVRSDSELLCRQIAGVYRVRKPHLAPLVAEVRRLLGRFERSRVSHVSREENREADELALQAARESQRRSS